MEAGTRRALRPLVEPARAYLRDLDADLVPHRLRAVVKSSARRLPAPLEKLLLEAVSEDETLRDGVAGQWDESGRSDPFVDAFLADPGSAMAAAGALEEEAELARLKDRVASLEREKADLESVATEARGRAAMERKAHEASLKGEKAADKRARAGLERRADSAEAARRAMEIEVGEAKEELAAERQRVESLEQDNARLRSRAGVLRRSARPAAPSDRPAVPTSPTGMARWLDNSERAMRPFRALGEGGDGPEERAEAISIPDGVSPDSAEALESLLVQRPRTVVIDGYNLAGALGHSPIHSSDARSAVIIEASSIRRRSGARVVVVFDAVGIEGRPGFTTDTGVEVVFSLERLADDEVVAVAIEGGPDVVVVSNDRDVRERAGLGGAITLWSDAVVAASNP